MLMQMKYEALWEALAQYVENIEADADPADLSEHDRSMLHAAREMMQECDAADAALASEYPPARIFVPDGRTVTLSGLTPEQTSTVMLAVGDAYKALFRARAAVPGHHPLWRELSDLQNHAGQFINAWCNDVSEQQETKKGRTP